MVQRNSAIGAPGGPEARDRVGTLDRAGEVLGHVATPLDVFFSPRAVAVIGATEAAGKVGRTVLWNLISSPFGGTVFPINSKRSSVLGLKAYPSLAALPDPVELAVIVTPAPTVPGIIEECVAAGVPAAIVISAGFKETGPAGVELERRILETARRGRMRIVGPNCLGRHRPARVGRLREPVRCPADRHP
jgi:acetyltransferase